MHLSVVVPAYNASLTIRKTLNSVLNGKYPKILDVEIIVVNDGSKDSAELEKIINEYPYIKLINHPENLGMCAGRNTGILASKGEFITILDADDEFLDDWEKSFQRLVQEWPEKMNVCFAKCVNPKGLVTAHNPAFVGELSLADILNEKNSGEYLPIFRGAYIRNKLYTDLKMRKSCGVVSYISFALDSSFWVSSVTLRLYNDDSAGSVSSAWLSSSKARETAKCYGELFKRYSDLYKMYAPDVYRTKRLRYAVYLRFAGIPGAFEVWLSAISFNTAFSSLAAGVVILLGPALSEKLILTSKRIGLLRKYG